MGRGSREETRRAPLKTVIHVAEAEIAEESGMGRVAWHWRDAFQKAGYEFLHVGPARVGGPVHPAYFPAKAFRAARQLGVKDALFLVHEPAAAPFVKAHPRTVVFSHGLERRAWEASLRIPECGKHIRFRSKILFPFWRLRGADYGLKRARAALLINRDDREYAFQHYGRAPGNTFLFRNGVYPTPPAPPRDGAEILFASQWIPRKGTETLVEAARLLRGVPLRWTLAATGRGEAEVLRGLPEELRPIVKIIPRFRREEEGALFRAATLFVMPSFFEGQPLSLLQAMEAGLCCITTDCCGQKDVIQHGENGFLFPPGDAREMARLIKLCLEDGALRERVGARARESMRERSWEAVSREVREWVEEKA